MKKNIIEKSKLNDKNENIISLGDAKKNPQDAITYLKSITHIEDRECNQLAKIFYKHRGDAHFDRSLQQSSQLKDLIFRVVMGDKAAAELLMQTRYGHKWNNNYLSNSQLISILDQHYFDKSNCEEYISAMRLSREEIFQLLKSDITPRILVNCLSAKIESDDFLDRLSGAVENLDFENDRDYLFDLAKNNDALEEMLSYPSYFKYFSNNIREIPAPVVPLVLNAINAKLILMADRETKIKDLCIELRNKLEWVLSLQDPPAEHEYYQQYVLIRFDGRDGVLKEMVMYNNLNDLKKDYCLLGKQSTINRARKYIHKKLTGDVAIVEIGNSGEIMSARKEKYQGYEKNQDKKNVITRIVSPRETKVISRMEGDEALNDSVHFAEILADLDRAFGLAINGEKSVACLLADKFVQYFQDTEFSNMIVCNFKTYETVLLKIYKDAQALTILKTGLIGEQGQHLLSNLEDLYQAKALKDGAKLQCTVRFNSDSPIVSRALAQTNEKRVSVDSMRIKFN
ncbi:MAG: hypothetical protein H0U71_08075 [Gammaproteobacteria bacterium]|nr:hypothetical protein [Gammaproteobacteria bacterium]